jgi:hypothetical protein
MFLVDFTVTNWIQYVKYILVDTTGEIIGYVVEGMHNLKDNE